MKMVIVAAAMSAVFMSGTANAQSFSESCGHLDNPTRFNPTELSAYQECWLDYHKPEEAAGVLGSVFYARAGEEFVSMPVSELRSAGSTEAAQAIVMGAIVDSAALDAAEAALEDVKAERDQLILDLASADDDLAAKIEELRVANETIGALEAAIDGAGTAEISVIRNGTAVSIAFVDRAAIAAEGDATAYSNGFTDGGDETAANLLVTSVVVSRDGGVRVNTANGSFSFMRGADYVADSYNTAIAAARTAAHNGYTLDVTGNTAADAAFSGATATETLVGDEYDVVDADDNVVATFATAGEARAYAFHDPSYSVVGRSLDTWSATVNGSTITFADSLFESNLVAQAVEAAYNVGFDDGYDEGYADGYANGFTDGVNSVR